MSTQYTISHYEKENHPKLSQICSYGICSKGPKNEFETAVVNEPSVFEPLKFYCMWQMDTVIGIAQAVLLVQVCTSRRTSCNSVLLLNEFEIRFYYIIRVK